MKLLIQRVSGAKVSLKTTGRVVGEIGSGMLVLLGVKAGDTLASAKSLAEKLVKLRIFSDVHGKMSLDVNSSGGKILLVPQFTLYANTTGGNRPSFKEAEQSDKAEAIFNAFTNELKNLAVEVVTGKFGEYMLIDSNLDGPVTIILEQ